MVHSELIKNLIKVHQRLGGMTKMGKIVLAINYQDEPLCNSNSTIVDWLVNNNVKVDVDSDYFEVGEMKVDFDYMPKINTLSFGVQVDNDADFPSLLFNFIDSLNDNKTIVSIAECFDETSLKPSNCELIYEANLKRFKKEIIESE